MPACRGMRLRPPPGGAPLAPVVAPGESRRRGLLVKNEHRPVFVQGRRSCHSPFGLTRFPTGPMSSGPELAKCSRQIECTGDVERRLLHRFRVGLAPRDLDEQETFRKRCVAGAQSAVTERCLSASPHPRMLQARRRVARSGMAHTGISEWHWLWQEVRPFVRYQAASLLCILSASFVSLVDPLRMKWLASGGNVLGTVLTFLRPSGSRTVCVCGCSIISRRGHAGSMPTRRAAMFVFVRHRYRMILRRMSDDVREAMGRQRRVLNEFLTGVTQIQMLDVERRVRVST
jgi:hypothetical protein